MSEGNQGMHRLESDRGTLQHIGCIGRAASDHSLCTCIYIAEASQRAGATQDRGGVVPT